MLGSHNNILPDLGPVYHETHLNRLIVEPFNAVSSLTMSLAALLIWLLLIRKDYKSYPFLAFVYVPLIFIGGLGSTFYHAFRASSFFLYMDVMPVLLLSILLSLFYWYKIYPNKFFIFIMAVLIILARGLPMIFFKGSAAINISYLLSGMLIIIPLAIFMFRTQFANWQEIAMSIGALLLALFFRYIDDFDYLNLSMGTHWLWHVFSGVGVWFLGVYIYRTS
ncbi:MAG: hypothetical protein GXO86_10600, partial [Chlorobi bacterium]|nr:hypothetical protein [Chlorobiota bacterium]